MYGCVVLQSRSTHAGTTQASTMRSFYLLICPLGQHSPFWLYWWQPTQLWFPCKGHISLSLFGVGWLVCMKVRRSHKYKWKEKGMLRAKFVRTVQIYVKALSSFPSISSSHIRRGRSVFSPSCVQLVFSLIGVTPRTVRYFSQRFADFDSNFGSPTSTEYVN